MRRAVAIGLALDVVIAIAVIALAPRVFASDTTQISAELPLASVYVQRGHLVVESQAITPLVRRVARENGALLRRGPAAVPDSCTNAGVCNPLRGGTRLQGWSGNGECTLAYYTPPYMLTAGHCLAGGIAEWVSGNCHLTAQKWREDEGADAALVALGEGCAGAEDSVAAWEEPWSTMCFHTCWQLAGEASDWIDGRMNPGRPYVGEQVCMYWGAFTSHSCGSVEAVEAVTEIAYPTGAHKLAHTFYACTRVEPGSSGAPVDYRYPYSAAHAALAEGIHVAAETVNHCAVNYEIAPALEAMGVTLPP